MFDTWVGEAEEDGLFGYEHSLNDWELAAFRSARRSRIRREEAALDDAAFLHAMLVCVVGAAIALTAFALSGWPR